jgi:hypothetical protein
VEMELFILPDLMWCMIVAVHHCTRIVGHTSVNLEHDTSLLHFFVSGNVAVGISWDSFLPSCCAYPLQYV